MWHAYIVHHIQQCLCYEYYASADFRMAAAVPHTEVTRAGVDVTRLDAIRFAIASICLGNLGSFGFHQARLVQPAELVSDHEIPFRLAPLHERRRQKDRLGGVPQCLERERDQLGRLEPAHQPGCCELDRPPVGSVPTKEKWSPHQRGQHTNFTFSPPPRAGGDGVLRYSLEPLS